MPQARAQLARAVAYVEIHIEQGPVLDEREIATAAVDGCMGVRRSMLSFSGRAGHAGATPMRPAPRPRAGGRAVRIGDP